MENVVIIAPSKKNVDTLPFQKISDRKNFKAFYPEDIERMGYWKKILKMNTILGDEFVEAVESRKVRKIVEHSLSQLKVKGRGRLSDAITISKSSLEIFIHSEDLISKPD